MTGAALQREGASPLLRAAAMALGLSRSPHTLAFTAAGVRQALRSEAVWSSRQQCSAASHGVPRAQGFNKQFSSTCPLLRRQRGASSVLAQLKQWQGKGALSALPSAAANVELEEFGDDKGLEYDDRPANDKGEIQIRNSQRRIHVDMDRVHRQLEAVLEVVGKRDHDVSLWLTNDRSIREYNDRYCGKRKATDILSFPFHQYEKPGVPTKESMMMNGNVRDLGDMIVSLEYVERQCRKDKEDLMNEGQDVWEEEKGASGAMARVFDVEGRLPYLMVHGVLHLMGYDHEVDGEHEVMANEEERVIERLHQMFPDIAER